jgi:hypothetical protein
MAESTKAAWRRGAPLREELARVPFALAMSSGFSSFFAHTGFLSVLLPRSGPFKLHEGRRAFRVAREATKRALDRTVADGYLVA